MNNTPQQIAEIGEDVKIQWPNRVLDITPIKHGSSTVDWLYHFSDDPDEKLTTEELKSEIYRNLKLTQATK